MAEPIPYTPRPPKIEADPHEALERLLQTAHEHGVLRFANDLIASGSQWSQILLDGLNQAGARNAVQNLAILLMALSRIEPSQFYKLVFAAKDGLEHLATPDGEKASAPGVRGVFKLFGDEALWRALTPMLEALKKVGAGLDREVQKPISEFTGKPTA